MGHVTDRPAEPLPLIVQAAHNRACRRELKRRGIDPASERALEECRCTWPFVIFGDDATRRVASGS